LVRDCLGTSFGCSVLRFQPNNNITHSYSPNPVTADGFRG
jgi:hypothetical protein